MNKKDRDARDPRGAQGVSLFGTGAPHRPSDMDLVNANARAALVSSANLPLFAPARVWKSLTVAGLSDDKLIENGLFPHSSSEPAVAAFDLLRTRIVQGLAQKNWRRIAVTSPTHGCGKSFVAANLALSLSRRPEGRSVLVDLDLRSPQLAQILGMQQPLDLHEFLMGEQPLEAAFRRHGRQLALGLNTMPAADASEMLQDPELHKSLDSIMEQLDPEIVVYDMPPALVCDDLLAISDQIDAVLLVIDGTKTSPEDIRRCEELLKGSLPLMGVVMNRSQDLRLGRYRYRKD